MANACIAYDNLFDDAFVLASSQQVLAPASNLQTPHIAERWRSGATDTAYVIADFGALVALDTVALMGMTTSALGTARVRLSSADSSGAAGDVHDSGAQAIDTRYGQTIVLLAAPESARYLRIDLSDAGADFVELGRVFAGVRAQYTVNFSYGGQTGRVDRSTLAKTRGGQTQIFRAGTYRVWSLSFDFLDEDQANDLVEEIDRVNGTKDDVLLIKDPDSDNLARDTIWGLMSELTMVTQAGFEIFSKPYKIEERL